MNGVLLVLLSIYIALLVIGFNRNPRWAAASVGWLVVSSLTAGLIAWIAVGPDAPPMAGMTVAFIALGFLVIGPPIALFLAIAAAARRPAAYSNGRGTNARSDRRDEPVDRFLHPDASPE